MQHLRSPYMPSSTDLAGGFGTIRSSKDVLRAPLPVHTYNALSPRPSLEALSMTTLIQQASSTTISLEELEPMQWATPPNLSLTTVSQNVPFAPSTRILYDYTQNSMSYNDNNNYNFTYTPGSSCPWSYSGTDLTGLLNNARESEAYPLAAYQIEPQKHHNLTPLSNPGANNHLMQMSDNDEHHDSPHIKHENHSGYHSPYSDLTRASTPTDDPSRFSHDQNSGDANIIDKEQPYAQLIYEALLEANDHAMILRDIYAWFKKYTDKASASETKGWQNSIRHNLSMNRAFEKVDQPCEESRKVFIWRLTNEAVREGVKSTARYRSKQPNKRGDRTHPPQPQRQASGAKGGQATRRLASMRRSKRMSEQYRSEPYISRSVPATFDPSYHKEAPMPYPPSPYYRSRVKFGYSSKNDSNDFGSPLMGHNLDLFPSARLYTS